MGDPGSRPVSPYVSEEVESMFSARCSNLQDTYSPDSSPALAFEVAQWKAKTKEIRGQEEENNPEST